MADVDSTALREHYAEMPDGELLALATEADLLEAVARRLVHSELQRRGLGESDVSAFRARVQAEARKAERARRKRLYRVLVGAGGPWERAFHSWKWATFAAYGTAYLLRLVLLCYVVSR